MWINISHHSNYMVNHYSNCLITLVILIIGSISYLYDVNSGFGNLAGLSRGFFVKFSKESFSEII